MGRLRRIDNRLRLGAAYLSGNTTPGGHPLDLTLELLLSKLAERIGILFSQAGFEPFDHFLILLNHLVKLALVD